MRNHDEDGSLIIDKPYRLSMALLFMLGYAPVIFVIRPLEVPFAIEIAQYASEALCASDLLLIPSACRGDSDYLLRLSGTAILYGLYSILLVVAAAVFFIAPHRPVGTAFRAFLWRYGLSFMASLLFIEILAWIFADKVESFGQLAPDQAAGREVTRLLVWVGMHTWMPAYLIWIWPEPLQVKRWLHKART